MHSPTKQKCHIFYVSFIAVAVNSRDRYEIIGLFEISHLIKQPCRKKCLPE